MLYKYHTQNINLCNANGNIIILNLNKTIKDPENHMLKYASKVAITTTTTTLQNTTKT